MGPSPAAPSAGAASTCRIPAAGPTCRITQDTGEDSRKPPTPAGDKEVAGVNVARIEEGFTDGPVRDGNG